jgi:electron transfer flavoprotein alpha subunit
MKTKQNRDWKGVWVFGDYRNYFQNRVTLQLIAKGKQLAGDLHTDLTVLLLGSQIHQYAMEYAAHGADAVMVVDHPNLKNYQVETYVRVVSELVGTFKPAIFLAGATAFGREFFPRLAKRLNTGLSAD